MAFMFIGVACLDIIVQKRVLVKHLGLNQVD